jgi:hypothetical protein
MCIMSRIDGIFNENLYILNTFFVTKEKLEVKCSNKTHTSCQPVEDDSLARHASRRASV